MVPGRPIPTTNEANGRNVEDVLLQLTHRSRLPRKNAGARRNGNGARERTRTVPVTISQAVKADGTKRAKMTRRIEIGTADCAVLRVRHSGKRRRA